MSKYYKAEDVIRKRAEDLADTSYWEWGNPKNVDDWIEVAEMEFANLPTIEVMEYPQVDGITPTLVTTESDDLIKRADAIEALGEEPYVWTDDDEFAQGERSQWIDDVSAIKAVPSADRPQGEWIPCSERLPEEDGHYIVYAPSYIGGSSSGKEIHNGAMFSRFKSGKWSIEVGYHKRPNCVKAWMPLPKPLKGADNEM